MRTRQRGGTKAHRRPRSEGPIARRLLQVLGLAFGLLLVLGYAVQGWRSTYIPKKNELGHLVTSFDVTPRLVGTRNLLLDGVNPYSDEGQRRIETSVFGEPVQDNEEISDKQRFAYPIYVVFLYAPTILLSYSSAHLVLFAAGLLMLFLTVFFWYRMIWHPPHRLFLVAILFAYSLSWFASQAAASRGVLSMVRRSAPEARRYPRLTGSRVRCNFSASSLTLRPSTNPASSNGRGASAAATSAMSPASRMPWTMTSCGV